LQPPLGSQRQKLSELFRWLEVRFCLSATRAGMLLPSSLPWMPPCRQDPRQLAQLLRFPSSPLFDNRRRKPPELFHWLEARLGLRAILRGKFAALDSEPKRARTNLQRRSAQGRQASSRTFSCFSPVLLIAMAETFVIAKSLRIIEGRFSKRMVLVPRQLIQPP
jgi:hypothetical protein